MIIRKINKNDIGIITNIYNWYIENTIITFETMPITENEMAERVTAKLQKYDWIVAEQDAVLIGYAYYDMFRTREAYKHTIESTIYLSHNSIGKGYGTILYNALIDSAKDKGFREMMGVIALPNDESIKLHLKTGFEEKGVLKNIGYKFNKYIDVAFLQKTLVDN